jgi:hypothetical protein
VVSAADHSLNFGLYHRDSQIGYARILSDYALVAYLADVFIIGEYRGRGLSKWLCRRSGIIPICRDYVAGCWIQQTRIDCMNNLGGERR